MKNVFADGIELYNIVLISVECGIMYTEYLKDMENAMTGGIELYNIHNYHFSWIKYGMYSEYSKEI